MVQEDHGLPHKIQVLVSKDLGKDELVVGQEDLKDLNILHTDFPKTLPEWRRGCSVHLKNDIRALESFREPWSHGVGN